MSGYAFRHASRYRAETLHGGRGWAHEVCGHIFEGGQRSFRGQSAYRNALWLPNLVRRAPDLSVGTARVKGHAGVIRGQSRVKLLRKCTMVTKYLVGRITDQSVMHYWGLRSCRGQLGSSRGQFA